jgi:inorganic phosphate transporter, PiT family
MHPLQAASVAAVFNLLGPLVLGAAVANTVAGIVTVPSDEAIAVIGAGLAAAVAWNVITWWLGLPSSSGHALLGGLVGAALPAAWMPSAGAAWSPGGPSACSAP